MVAVILILYCHYWNEIHTAGHVTGYVTPSHEWTEGLLDFYHFTGKREGLEKAISIADNIIRHLDSPKLKNAGGFAARETGWAMRGLIGVYLESGDAKYLKACDAIAEQFIDWKQEWGAFLAPYTSHTQLRVPFMISIAVNALARYNAVKNDDRVKKLIVDEMRDLLENCVMPDGRFFYKELPSLNRRAGSSREMEALCHAYLNSGDTVFLNQVSLMMEMMVVISQMDAICQILICFYHRMDLCFINHPKQLEVYLRHGAISSLQENCKLGRHANKTIITRPTRAH